MSARAGPLVLAVVVAAVLLPGCYLGARGGLDRVVHRSAEAVTAAPQGHVDLGFYVADDHRALALLGSLGSPPMTAASVPRAELLSVGARYEHAVDDDVRWLRGFGRITVGVAARDAARASGMTSVALGLAFTATERRASSDRSMPTVATAALAVVYAYGVDETLGAADFLGLELSVAAGADFLTGMIEGEDR